MKTENIEMIRKLTRDAKVLGTMIDKYRDVISEPRCDKHNLRFGGDGRFTVFSAKVAFTGYTGYYGDSGCKTFATLASDTAQELLTAALNKNMALILRDMASAAKDKAATLRHSAEDELSALQALINGLDEAEEMELSK